MTASMQSIGTPNASTSIWKCFRHGDLRTERLAGLLTDLERDIAFQSSVRPGPWKEHADACVADAKEALAKGRRDDLARSCAHAYRMLLHGVEQPQLDERAALLREEAEGKLSNWRKQAVRDLLGPREAHATITAPRLALAQFVLDQHFQNVYFKLEVTTRRMPWIGGMLAGLAVAAYAVSFMPNGSDSKSFMFDPHRTLLVLLLGALGAMLSHSLTVLGATGRIPELVGAGKLWVRPLLGAVSAVAVVVVLESGLLPIKQPTEATIYAYAVAAGFTDQLLTRVMRQIEQSAGR